MTPSPAATTAASCSSPWSAPTCSSCPWTIGGSGTATTTCSPTCCGRTCSPSGRTRFRSCTSAPACGTSATTSRRRRSGTPWPARDFDRAAYLIELAAPAIRRHRQEALLLGWLKALPDDAIRRSPMLSVFYGHMLMVSGDLAAAEARLDDAERALAAVPDGQASPVGRHRGAPDPPGDHRHLPGLARASPRRCGGHGGTRPARARPGRPRRPSRAGRCGRVPRTRRVGERRCHERAGDLHAGGGEPARGRQPGRRAEQHRHARRHVARGGPTEQGTPALPGRAAAWPRHTANAWPVQPPTCTWGSARSTSKPETSTSARRHLEIAAALGDRSPMTERRYRWFVAMGLARPRRGRPGGGRQPPGPGGAAVPSGLPSRRATHRGDEGPGPDRAGQAVRGRRLGT